MIREESQRPGVLSITLELHCYYCDGRTLVSWSGKGRLERFPVRGDGERAEGPRVPSRGGEALWGMSIGKRK